MAAGAGGQPGEPQPQRAPAEQRFLDALRDVFAEDPDLARKTADVLRAGSIRHPLTDAPLTRRPTFDQLWASPHGPALFAEWTRTEPSMLRRAERVHFLQRMSKYNEIAGPAGRFGYAGIIYNTFLREENDKLGLPEGLISRVRRVYKSFRPGSHRARDGYRDNIESLDAFDKQLEAVVSLIKRDFDKQMEVFLQSELGRSFQARHDASQHDR